MSKIAYDPTKDQFAKWIRRSRLLRSLFYRLLDLFFLRSWYVRSALREQYRNRFSKNEQWKLLDAGSGFGQYDRYILRKFRNARIHAVDVKQDYLDDCRFYFQRDIATGRIEFDSLDLVDQELPKTAFDLALCVDVLEHIEEDVTVMSRIRSALKPGGVFIMHSPSHYSEEDAGEDEFFVDEHARAGYSKEELRQKFEKAGLEPISLRYSYGEWGHRAWELLIKVPMLWFTRFGMKTMLWLPFYYLATLVPGLIMMAVDRKRDNHWGTGIIGMAQRPQKQSSVK